MLENFLTDPAAIERRRAGIFGPHLDSFVATIAKLGYARSTVRAQLWLLDHLERWLKRKSLAVVDLEERVVDQFLVKRRRKGRRSTRERRIVRAFLEHLREKGVIPLPTPTKDESPLETLHKRYEDYLRKERGLSAATVAAYWYIVRHFIVDRFGQRPVCLSLLIADDISGFLLRNARSGAPESTRLMVTALRSFFRFLFRHGETKTDLAGAVPTVATWRLAEVPRYLDLEEVERILHACNRSISVGRRDYAVILLLVRLGLRAGEVLALELDDIDWRAGVLTVRGKGGCHDRLPLPLDVGEAVAAYPSLNRKNVTPHVLRHTAAMQLLEHGIDRSVIALWLGHESVETTQMYLHADLRLKEQALAKITPTDVKPGRYRPDDDLLAFLEGL